MIWLTWRQHRAAIATFALIFGVVAALYLVDGLRVNHEFADSGLASCVGVTNDPGCASRREDFLSFHLGWLLYLGPLLTLGSGALGVFLGAPLVAAEVERGTHQWAWTQRVSPARWLAVKYLMLAAAIATLAAGLGAAYTWWARPLTQILGPFVVFTVFDNTPLLLAVYSVFGFAVGVAASTVVRRTVPAMGVVVLIFLVARVGITYGLRPHYLAPQTVASAASGAGVPLGFDPRDWDWRSRWVDAAGNTVPETTISYLMNPAYNPDAAGLDEGTVLTRHGIHYVDRVQPYQRAGTFQLIEFGIYSCLIAILVAVAFLGIRRRTG
jgi:hypothetical protein